MECMVFFSSILTSHRCLFQCWKLVLRAVALNPGILCLVPGFMGVETAAVAAPNPWIAAGGLPSIQKSQCHHGLPGLQLPSLWFPCLWQRGRQLYSGYLFQKSSLKAPHKPLPYPFLPTILYSPNSQYQFLFCITLLKIFESLTAEWYRFFTVHFCVVIRDQVLYDTEFLKSVKVRFVI